MAEGQSHSSPVDHVLDHPSLELPGVEVHLPAFDLGGIHFQLTRFMVMELIAAILIAVVAILTARHASKNLVTKGRFYNMIEALVIFVRDNIVRPSFHGHGEEFLPFLLTLFFFIMVNNLLGLVPGGASATSSINVTAGLALVTFGIVVVNGIRTSGPVGFWTSLVPPLDVPAYMKVFLWPMMFVIEVVGLLIRHIVLAARLWANMFVGHIILVVLLGFILEAAGRWIVVLVAPMSIALSLPMNMLELFIALLQAYVFTFLTALFIGAAVHPHH